MAHVSLHSQRLGSSRVAVASPRTGRRTVPCIRAQGDGKGQDWDKAWARFQQQMQSQVDNPSQSSPRAAPPRKAPVRSVQQDELRRQERVLLDFWTSESFYKVGAVGACAFLLLFAVLMGPPPSDGRCTLPWC